MIVPDLQRFRIRGVKREPIERIAIGWLGRDAFATAPPNEALLQALCSAYKNRVRQTRGIHDCQLCGSDDFISIDRGGESYLLGNAEFEIEGNDGKIYAAPTLICHYIEKHSYSPPEEFVQAAIRQYGKSDDTAL